MDSSGRPYRAVVAELLRETLDALGVDRACLVGGSIGSLWALRLAQAHPSRVERLVLLGGGPLTAEIRVPTFIRLLRAPLGKVIVRVPEKPRMVAKQLAGLGHATGGEPARSRRRSTPRSPGSGKPRSWCTARRIRSGRSTSIPDGSARG